MTGIRRLPERAVSALVGTAVGALLLGLVAASFVLVPHGAPVREATAARAEATRAAPIARGLARTDDEDAAAMPASAGVASASTAAGTVAADSIDVGAYAAPAPEPTSAPTPEPTPAPATPTPAPTRAPTPRPTAAPIALPALVTAGTRDAELRMLVLMNASRVAGGLAPLALDAGVSVTARAHSQVESQVGYVYHDGPDGTARARDSAACGSGWYGENTGKVWNGNVDRLHIEFMSEPWAPINHRTNIMDPAFARVGIGAVQGSDALYMTMVFCR